MEKLLVANYKMNGNKNFYQKVSKVVNKIKTEDTIVLCPPFVYMPFFKLNNKNVFLGGQDLAANENKKSTGQTSASMLNEFGAKYVLIGHSERREIGESDELVAKKVEEAQSKGLIPIVCVGEENRVSKLTVLAEQVKLALNGAINDNIVFAYEPIWAIGTGEQPNVPQINKALRIIKDSAEDCGYKVKVLYGGSVNAENYKDILTSKVNGLLMGGVSLKLNDFLKIVKGE